MTLINVFATEGGATMTVGNGADGAEPSSERGRLRLQMNELAPLRELLVAAQVPLSFAAPLAAAAAEDAVGVGELLLRAGATERQRLERIAKRAALPLGHRLRLVNALRHRAAPGAAECVQKLQICMDAAPRPAR